MIFAASGQADTIFRFTEDGCSRDCGQGPFGTVQLTQLTPLSVRVLVTLGPNSSFAGTGAGQALTFNISGNAAITIDSITAGFVRGNDDVKASAFGDFEHSVRCIVCQGGQSDVRSLSFRVWSGSGLTLDSFVGNGSKKGNYFFASDIVGTTGFTGNVAALAGSYYPGDVATPEPGTLCVTGVAAVLLALAGRRRVARTVGE